MLAKIWKKVLLAICILACIFNIMSKLVNRHSFEDNLKSVNDGTTVFGIFQNNNEKIEEKEQSDTIEGVIINTNTEENKNITNTLTSTEESSVEQNSQEEVSKDDENVQENTESANAEDDETSKGISYTDVISNFFSF